MGAWLRDLTTLVWLLLISATGLSWVLGTDQTGAAFATHGKQTVAIILVAFFKVRLVIRYFMEVRTAPLMLRLACDAWIVLVCGVVLLLYLMGPR
jgi:hypothetical protein